MQKLHLAAALVASGLVLPSGVANHPQTVGPYTVSFDHDGDNEWWVEV